MEQSSKIYVAGHRGMVGSAILRALEEKGYSNTVTRDFATLDLMNQSATEAFFKEERPEYVFLAAAKVGGIVANNTYRAQFIYENLQIQNNIIHFAWKYRVKRLLFLGSSCIYPKFAPQPIREESLLTGELEYTNEPYAIAKIAGLKMCEAYNMQYGTNFISVMPTNLYGPNDNYDLEKSHVLPALMRKMHLARCLEQGKMDAIRKDLDKRPVEGVNGRSDETFILQILRKYGIHGEPMKPGKVSLSLWGSGNPLREFMHVDDLAAACVYLMNQEGHSESSGHVNIGTGTDLSIRELAELVRKVTGFEGSVAWDASKPDGTPRKLLDVSRLHALGFTAQTGLEEGIRKTYSYYLNGEESFR